MAKSWMQLSRNAVCYRRRGISGTSIAGVVLLVVVLAVAAAYLFANPPVSGATATANQYSYTAYGQTTSTATSMAAVTGTGAPPANAVYVYIPNDGGYPFAPFEPSTITVVLGVNSTVVWVNQDVLVHNVNSNGGFFNSGDIAPNGQWWFTFTTAGVYPYYCSYHPSHTGVVIVESAPT